MRWKAGHVRLFAVIRISDNQARRATGKTHLEIIQPPLDTPRTPFFHRTSLPLIPFRREPPIPLRLRDVGPARGELLVVVDRCLQGPVECGVGEVLGCLKCRAALWASCDGHDGVGDNMVTTIRRSKCQCLRHEPPRTSPACPSLECP